MPDNADPPQADRDTLMWDEEMIGLLSPLLEEVMNDAQPDSRPPLLRELTEVVADLGDICARLSGRPLTSSQVKALTSLEMLSGSLTAKVADFVALFEESPW